MKVIGSGFGRTGTLSMKYALQELGFDPCYHMETLFKNPSHMKLWHDVAMGKSKNWDKIFSEHQAAVDYPASLYYQELIEKYPDAKVVHTVRDPERWYNSTRETIYQSHTLFPWWLKAVFPPIRQLSGTVDAIWIHIFDGRFEDRDHAIKVFEDWTEEVKRTVPPERLLIFEVKQGWEPLCEFLGVPVPDMPFPHVNDRKTMSTRLTIARTIFRFAPIVAILIVMILLLTVVF